MEANVLNQIAKPISRTPLQNSDLEYLSWIYNMQTLERRGTSRESSRVLRVACFESRASRRVASHRVVQTQIVNSLRDATFDGCDAVEIEPSSI